MNNYDVGDVVRVMATFTNSAGTAVDPSSVYAFHKIVKPEVSNTTTIAYGVDSMVRLAAGIYYTDIPVNTGGEWHYRFRGRGANAAAVEGNFQVLMPIVGE